MSSAPLSEETKSEKKALRAAMKAGEGRSRRAAWGDRCGIALRRKGIGFSGSAPPAWVSGFLPIGEELDPAPLMLRLSAEGYGLCLPVMEAKGKPLLFRALEAW